MAWLAATKPDPPATPSTEPQARGTLPIIGYEIKDGSLEIDYLQPDGATIRWWTDDPAPSECSVKQAVTGLGSDRATIYLKLYWTDRPEAYDTTDQACRAGGTWSRYPHATRVAKVASGTTVLTNGAIVDPDGTVLAPAAPGNVVPERNA